MTKQFIGCFGTTKHMKRFRITYLFDEKKIEICLNNDGYVRFSFNDILKMEIYSLIEEASDMFLNRLNNEVASIMDNITAIGVMKRHLTEVLFSIFKMKLKSFIFRQEEACWLLCQSSCMISLLVKWI